MPPGSPTIVVVRRVLPAPPTVVWDDWLDPDALREWMCPRPARATQVSLDGRPGGRFRIDIAERGEQFYVEGAYLRLERPHELQFTWTCSNWAEPTETRVTVTLDPHADDETLMTIRHESLPEDLSAQHRDGWERIAGQLGRQLQP
jgi:uncharacterized protein YndB with AHSA1/START domain